MSELIRKAQPTPSDAHVNKPLTNISVAYIQTAGFVADQVFPIVPVEMQSDLFYKYNRDDFWRDEAKTRAPGSESAGGGFGLSTDSYRCTVEAFHKDVSDQLRANADSVLQLDRAATEFVTQKLMIRRERRWMSTFFTTGVWGTDMAGAASADSTHVIYWSTSATSTPREDVDAAKNAIVVQSGIVPNTIVLGYKVLNSLRSNAEIRDQFKYTSAASINTAMLANFWDIGRVLVSSAVYTTSAEGATVATDFIGGNNALVCYSTPAPALMQPTAGYTFQWNGL